MRIERLILAAAAMLLLATGAQAASCQDTTPLPGIIYGDNGSGTCSDARVISHALSVSGTFTPSGTGDVNIKQVNGATVNVGVGAAGTGTQRVTTSTDSTIGIGAGTAAIGFVGPSQRTLVTLDVKTVTTGGSAVTAIAVGHRTAGGLLCNPQGATINLGINEIGTAAGTTSSGDTTFIIPGQCYKVAPAADAVSVITSDSSHPFSGYGLN